MQKVIFNAIAFTLGTQVARQIYPPVSKFCVESYDSISKVVGGLFEDELPERKKRFVKKLSPYQIDKIKSMWQANKDRPSHKRLTQVELCRLINHRFNLNYSRGGYCNIVNRKQKKEIPLEPTTVRPNEPSPSQRANRSDIKK